MAVIMIKIVIGVLLLSCGIQDIIKKRVYLWVIIIGIIAIGACVPFCGAVSLSDRLGGISVGLFVIIISKTTGGKIGMGDGLLLCATGLGLGFWGNMELFGTALFIAAVASIVLLIFRVVDRKKSLPFVPFMFGGYLIYTLTSAGIGL